MELFPYSERYCKSEKVKTISQTLVHWQSQRFPGQLTAFSLFSNVIEIMSLKEKISFFKDKYLTEINRELFYVRNIELTLPYMIT